MKAVCAWCGKDLGGRGGPTPGKVTHGICPRCQAKLLRRSKDREEDSRDETERGEMVPDLRRGL